jgi:hypothetical protein
MILALVIFATTTGPVAVSVSRLWMPTRAACEAFHAATAVQIEADRLRYEARAGVAVEAVTVCHSVGAAA